MSTDINNLTNLEDQIIDFDPEQDLNAVVLPRAGDYDVIYRLGKKGIYGPTKDKDGNLLPSPKQDKLGRGFIVAELEGTIVAPDTRFDGQRIFGIYITSQVMRTGTSSMADFLNKAGLPLSRGMKLSEIRDHAEAALSSEPTVRTRIDWEASQKQDDAYVTVLSGMRNFPQAKDSEGNLRFENEEGEFVHYSEAEFQELDADEKAKLKVVHDPVVDVGADDVTARIQVKRYLAQPKEQAASA